MDIFELVARGDGDGVERLLAAEPALSAARHPSGASLLAWAHYVGQPQLVDRLPRPGDLDPHDAIILGDTARVEALLESGWDPDERAPDGFTPLALAAFFSRDQVFDLLLELTRDIDAQASNTQHVSALHAAAARREARMVEKLLRAGAAPDLRQQAGFTALHAAAQNDDALTAGLLLLFGADPTIRVDDGRSAADLARAAGHDWLAIRLAARLVTEVSAENRGMTAR